MKEMGLKKNIILLIITTSISILILVWILTMWKRTDLIGFYTELIFFIMIEFFILFTMTRLIRSKSKVEVERSKHTNAWVVFFLVISMILPLRIVQLLEDIPITITKQYEECIGICSETNITGRKISYLEFVVNGQTYSISERYLKDIIIGESYKVVFLPNSEYVIDIIRIDD